MSRKTNNIQYFIRRTSNLCAKSDTVLRRRGKHEITEIHRERENIKESVEKAQGSSDSRTVTRELHRMKHELQTPRSRASAEPEEVRLVQDENEDLTSHGELSD
jgi:hypothetical protein